MIDTQLIDGDVSMLEGIDALNKLRFAFIRLTSFSWQFDGQKEMLEEISQNTEKYLHTFGFDVREDDLYEVNAILEPNEEPNVNSELDKFGEYVPLTIGGQLHSNGWDLTKDEGYKVLGRLYIKLPSAPKKEDQALAITKFTKLILDKTLNSEELQKFKLASSQLIAFAWRHWDDKDKLEDLQKNANKKLAEYGFDNKHGFFFTGVVFDREDMSKPSFSITDSYGDYNDDALYGWNLEENGRKKILGRIVIQIPPKPKDSSTEAMALTDYNQVSMAMAITTC